MIYVCLKKSDIEGYDCRFLGERGGHEGRTRTAALAPNDVL